MLNQCHGSLLGNMFLAKSFTLHSVPTRNVKWCGFGHEYDAWEPAMCFLLGGRALNAVFVDYFIGNGVEDVLAVA